LVANKLARALSLSFITTSLVINPGADFLLPTQPNPDTAGRQAGRQAGTDTTVQPYIAVTCVGTAVAPSDSLL